MATNISVTPDPFELYQEDNTFDKVQIEDRENNKSELKIETSPRKESARKTQKSSKNINTLKTKAIYSKSVPRKHKNQLKIQTDISGKMVKEFVN